MGPPPRSIRGLIVAAAFAAAAAGTWAWCASMGDGMAMPGGWTMSMTWMRMRGSWAMSWAMFVAMWATMMIAMMLPSLAPVMLRHRRPVRVAIAYFGVWAVAGAVVHPIGAWLASIEMSSRAIGRAVPVVAGAVIGLAGLAQWTPWKMRELDRCRDRSCCAPGRRAGPGQAWRDGARLGVHCVGCCVPPMAVLVAAGAMSPLPMAAVGAAITVERLAPRPHRVARGLGAIAIVVGAVVIVRR